MIVFLYLKDIKTGITDFVSHKVTSLFNQSIFPLNSYPSFTGPTNRMPNQYLLAIDDKLSLVLKAVETYFTTCDQKRSHAQTYMVRVCVYVCVWWEGLRQQFMVIYSKGKTCKNLIGRNLLSCLFYSE